MIKRKLKSILVTGGCGFIGSNFIRYIFDKTDFSGRVINVDNLTYAGNPENLKDIEENHGQSRYFFEKADITDFKEMERIIRDYKIDTIVHFAAESHVDRSIFGPQDFIQTNIIGTFTLLEVVREFWKNRDDVLFHHISTDEVYGSLGETGLFSEDSPYDPRSPYSASKASSDHLVRAYFHTYKIPITLSNCSNNYGPFQFPEKMIPLMIDCMLNEKPLPVYGDGKNIRDWIFVDDHSSAAWLILQHGKIGEQYNIGGENEIENINLVNFLCERMANACGKDTDYYKKLITFVEDRAGHDRRYAIDCSKIKNQLGWKGLVSFEKGIDMTIKWYLENQEWVKHSKTGEYADWVKKKYGRE